MATTITLGGSINWAQSYTGFKSLTIGTASEPAVSSMNMLIQAIVGPPFSWNWNRASANFNTIAGTQDYSQSVTTFGFIEKADFKIPSAAVTNTALTAGVATYTATNNFQTGDLVTVTGLANNPTVYNVTNQPIVTATGSTFTVLINNANIGSGGDTGTAVVGTTTEISETVTILGTGSERGAPNKIAAQTDDNAGNISFRILPIPDRVYTVNVIFQKRIPALAANTSSTWAPIPDHYSYIYQWGFLALMLAYNQDVRWAQANQKFVGNLLGAAEGLSEEQKNIFQAAWLGTITEQQTTGMKAQQGVGSRGING
jgi:hypothetical protein